MALLHPCTKLWKGQLGLELAETSCLSKESKHGQQTDLGTANTRRDLNTGPVVGFDRVVLVIRVLEGSGGCQGGQNNQFGRDFHGKTTKTQE